MSGRGAKSGLMVSAENRTKINSLIKMYDRDPSGFAFPVISQDDAVTELIRVYERHVGTIRDPVTPASMIGPVKRIKIIGAEGL